MNVLPLIFLVAALVLFLVAAWDHPPRSRYNLIALGLACWVVSLLLGTVR